MPVIKPQNRVPLSLWEGQGLNERDLVAFVGHRTRETGRCAHHEDREGADEGTTNRWSPGMTYESGLDGYKMYPIRPSPWRRGHMRVGAWVNHRRFPQILETHQLLISDCPRSEAETDADASHI